MKAKTMLPWMLVLASAAVQAQTVTIRADNWYPMNGDPKSPKPGYMIEMAQAILAPQGIQVDYATMPWERAVHSVRAGEYDCVVGAFKEDTPDFVFPQLPWGSDQTTVYVKAGDAWRYTGLDSLESRKVGLIGGYSYHEAFDKYIEQNASLAQFIKGDNALENNIQKLLAGRIDTTVESPLVMAAKLKDMGLQGQVAVAGTLGEPNAMYIACSPAKADSQALVRMLDEGTRTLRESGALARILERYGLTDW
ncbi:MAG: transporter substrate-binding domain-containing protein [Gammaproteobacteria bacterium]|nr:transporter substrate-binding domain-containing protein [Gammaproteobacteria bacterium]